MINKRIISAAVAVPLLILFVVLGGTVFKAGIMAITLIGIYEYISAYKKYEHRVMGWIILLGFFLFYIILFLGKQQLFLPLIYVIVLLSMCTPIFMRQYSVISSALTLTGYIYIVNFFSLLILIRDMNNGNSLIWLVFIIAFACDTLAYYSGSYFGKHKLCPLVSPKKTVEGSVGGILGSVLAVVIWGVINKEIGFVWYQLILLGIIGGAISQLGDLSASLIKRYVGIKDYGNIMPGHGGILDRFDSILFTAPVVYYYIVFLLG